MKILTQHECVWRYPLPGALPGERRHRRALIHAMPPLRSMRQKMNTIFPLAMLAADARRRLCMILG